MSKVLIVSATSGTNLILAHNISDLLDVEREIVNLEDYVMPLYTPQAEEEEEHNNLMSCLSKKFISSKGLIFCAPEYNGGSPPILTNTITWLSVSTNNWRDAFLNKIAIISTHSGGAGARFLSTFRIQLEHLGVIVYPKTIMVNTNNSFNKSSAKKILLGYKTLL